LASPAEARFLQVDPVGYQDQVNLYEYVGDDPVNGNDPTGNCGYRYEDGSCQVKVDPKTGQAGIDAGKALEARLNKYDKAINGLDAKQKYTVSDSRGKALGSFTGKQLQRTWNNQKFSITSKSFGNGGYGRTIPGHTDLQPRAVESYSLGAVARGSSADVGVDTLAFHEVGHAFGPGLDAGNQNPVTGGQPNAAAESAASAQGRTISNSVGGEFMCDLPGPYGC
jgi:hypothetical protein